MKGLVGANNYSPLQGTTATSDVKSVPASVYILHMTDTNGKESHQKIVKNDGLQNSGGAPLAHLHYYYLLSIV